MTIARVRELAEEMAKAPTSVVCSFTREQMVDLLAEIDRRTRPVAAAPPPPAPAPAPTEIAAIADYVGHRRGCEGCTRGGASRCPTGQHLYAMACASLMDQARNLL
jgi:hypothetical protein